MSSTRPRFAFGKALRAAKALAADPDDLPQVFTVIEAFSGDTLERLATRFATSVSGRRLLDERPDIVDQLADREALAKLPAGTLGRAYLDFVESEKISAEGIRDASARGTSVAFPPPLDFIHARMRDTHDLWHAATGYKGDVLGEAALLAFTLAQTHNPAIALVVGIGLVKTLGKPEARAVILEGFRRGKKAAWLPDQPWESMLSMPVADVRRLLSLEAPPVYVPVRSAELKAERAAA